MLRSYKTFTVQATVAVKIMFSWHNDTQLNRTQHRYDIQHNDTQYKELIRNSQHK